jgi:hypothetical protein
MSKFKDFMAKIDERQAMFPQQQVQPYQDPQAEAKALRDGINKLGKIFNKLSDKESQKQWVQMGITSNGIQMQMPKDLLELDTNEIEALKNAKSGLFGEKAPLVDKGDGNFVINKDSIDAVSKNIPNIIKQSKLTPWDKTKNIAHQAYSGMRQTNVRSDDAMRGFSGVGAGRN